MSIRFHAAKHEKPVEARLKVFDPAETRHPSRLRVGQWLGRYRLQRRLGAGGFATVYAAFDTIEKRRVAIKVPDTQPAGDQTMEDVRREVRIMGSLRHPHILPLESARSIEGRFVMVFPLGSETLADRFGRRLGRATAAEFARQMVSAVAYAHQRSVLHRDVKPENFILFPENHLCLTDFGLARLERGRHAESASGTLGYIAPEQAMGKPSFRSDVFSLGLVIYRMLSGELPEYPFAPPLPGFNRLRRGLSRDFVAWIRKSIDPIPSRRFRDAVAMHNALGRIRSLTSESRAAARTAGSRRRDSGRQAA